MDAKKVINQLLIERNMSVADFAVALGMQTQSLRNKLNRDAYGLNDFLKMMEVLGCDVIVVAKDTGKEFY